MTEIVERLRRAAEFIAQATGKENSRWVREAADEIERLRFRLDYMESKYGKIQWDAALPPSERGTDK